MSFFRNVAQMLPVSRQIVLDVVAVELNHAARGLQQSGKHLYGGAFAGAVGAEAAENLSGLQSEMTDPAPRAKTRSAW